LPARKFASGEAGSDWFLRNLHPTTIEQRRLTGWTLQECQPHFLADNLPDLDAAQGLDAVSYQMQELLPLYAFYLTTFHIDENEFRHVVGDFKLRFAGNLDIDSFGHFAPR
jgi:hypothetical protein